MSLYLVTGGAGFIGSHIAARLLAQGHTVRVLDNLRTGKASTIHWLRTQGALEFYELSITDEAIAPLFDGVEVVFHHAALVSVPESLTDPLQTHHTCATGTLNVLSAARAAGVRRVVYASSSAAYGDHPRGVVSEQDAPAPISPYGAAKLAGELYCRAFAHSYALETVCLRYFNVFGPRQNPASAYAAAIPRFIARLLDGQPPVVYGTGEQTRDFVHVGNIVHANLLAAQCEGISGQVFNLGSGQRITLLTLIDMLNEIAGTNIAPLHEPTRPGDILHSGADITAARSVLGYEPVVGLLEGLRETFHAMQAAR